MKRLLLAVPAFLSLATPSAGAQGTKLTDIAPYLMPRAEEIALARSSAPNRLGEDAAVWVLTRDGYVEAEKGTNGFACFVGRGWSGPIVVGPPDARRLHPDVFDRQLRAPHCFKRARRAHRAALADRAHEAAPRWRSRRAGGCAPRGRSSRGSADARRAWRNGLDDVAAPGPRAGLRAVAAARHGLSATAVECRLGITGFSHDYPFVAESGTPWAVAMPMRVFSDGSHASETVTGRKAP